MNALLEIGGLEVAYGPSQVLFGLDLEVAEDGLARAGLRDYTPGVTRLWTSTTQQGARGPGEVSR